MSINIQPLSSEQLCCDCDPEQFSFETTADLEPLATVIGQDRAVSAMQFGISIRREGYNLFAMGSHGTGKYTAIRQFLDRQVANEAVPADWCYANNFEQPYKPFVLRLPPGQGQILCKAMQNLVVALHSVLPAAFEGEDYEMMAQKIAEEFKERQEQSLTGLREQGEAQGLALVRTQAGWGFVPTQSGQALTPEQFQQLPEADQEQLKKAAATMEQQLQTTMQQIQLWEEERSERIKALNRSLADQAVSRLIDALKQKFKELPEVVVYLEAVQRDVVENADDFRKQNQDMAANLAGTPLPRAAQGPPSFRRYQVNVLVDQSTSQGAPIVYEDHPTYQRLFGQVEYTLAQSGALVTDFNLIKAGSLHRANGGYLITDARKLLQQPFTWEQLKRALRANQITIEPTTQAAGLANTVSLEPDPIPMSIKIILLGDRSLYYNLFQLDPDFAELFKVVADFAEEMDRSPENNVAYAKLIGKIVRKEGLYHFDRAAVARVIEHSARLAGHSQKLSMQIQGMADLLREADHWARQADQSVVGVNHVQQALEAQIYRVDRVREQAQEQIEDETILIDTEGAHIGQVNGLSVLAIGNFSFGRPSRITARVRPGKGEVVDIEREVELGGPLHSKGVLILSSLLGARYTLNRPLSLSASLVFEQSYGGVDGDSASSAELYALLSALAEIPIKQSFAVTGSVNQRGQVQAIGGVNEKIEGFYDLCLARGLTGEQGVLIPASNVKHLMLRRDVIDSATEGQFHIYPVETIDQGIEILTGLAAGKRDDTGQFPAESINQRVENRLITLAEAWTSYNSAFHSP